MIMSAIFLIQQFCFVCIVHLRRPFQLSLLFSGILHSVGYACMCAKFFQLYPILQLYGLQSIRLLCSWGPSDKNTGVGCHFLLQGIFPTQGSNQYLLGLLNWQAGSLPLAALGKPSVGYIFSFLPCLSLLFFLQLFVSPPQITTLPSCFSFFGGGFCQLLPVQFMDLCPQFFKHSVYQIESLESIHHLHCTIIRDLIQKHLNTQLVKNQPAMQETLVRFLEGYSSKHCKSRM